MGDEMKFERFAGPVPKAAGDPEDDEDDEEVKKPQEDEDDKDDDGEEKEETWQMEGREPGRGREVS